MLTLTKCAKSDGKISMSGINEIWRVSGAREKSKGMLSAGG